MQTAHSGRGFFYLSVSNLFFYMSSYLIYFGIGRIMGPEPFGTFVIAFSMAGIVATIFVLGLQQSTSKFVTENIINAKAVLRRMLLLQSGFVLGCSLLFFLLAPLMARLLNDVGLITPLRVTSLFILFQSFYVSFLGYLNGLRRFGAQSLLTVFYNTTKVILVFLMVFLGFGVTGVLGGIVLACGIIVGICFLLFFRKGGSVNLGMRSIILFTLPLMVFNLLANTALSMDIFMVKALLPDAGVLAGVYGAVTTIARIPVYLIGGLSLALFPMVSLTTHTGNRKSAQNYIRGSLRYMLIGLAPIVLLISRYAESIIVLLYSSDYKSGALPLSILVLGLSFYAFFMILTTVTSGTGRSDISMYLSAGFLLVDVCLNYYLIPMWGLWGAAIATTIAMLSSSLAAMVYVRMKFGTLLRLMTVWKVIVASAVMYSISLMIDLNGVMLIVVLPMIAGIYFLILFMLKEITKKDVLLARDIIRSVIRRN